MFIVPWKLSEFNPAPYKSELGMRYFADVIDNNARREIWKSNSFYVDYHSRSKIFFDKFNIIWFIISS